MADIKQDTDTTQQKYEPAAKLYNNLISEGYTPENLGGSVDNFCMRMFNDEGSRRKLYDNLIKEGYTSDNIGEYDDFNASMAVNGMTHNQIHSIVSELRDSRTKAMKELDAYKKTSTYEPRIVTTGGAVAPAAPRQTVEYLPGYEEARQRLWNDENEHQYDMYRRAELMLEKSLMRKKTSLQREYADRMDAVDAAAAESGLMKTTQGPLSVGGPTITPQYIPEGASMSEYLKRTAALDMIKNYTTRTDELLKAPLKHESDGAWDAATDALKGSARGFADIAANPANYPVIGPIVETVRDKQVQALFQKANKGEQLSEEETMAYLSYINYLDAAEKIEPELAMSYKVGRGAAMSTSFALEMMLTGGLQAKGFAAIARSLASHGHKGAAAKVAAWLGDAAAMEKIKGAKAVRSQMNVMEKGLGQVAQDLMQTAMMPSTYSGIVADQTDAVTKGDDYEFKDVIRSLAGSGTEVVTEGTVGKAIDAGLKHTPLKRFVNHFYGSGSKLGRAHTKIQSPISENAEEYAGALMDYIRSYNPMFDEESNAQLREGAMQQFSGEGAAETALTVLLNPLQIAGLGAQGVTDAVNRKTLGNIKKNYEEAENRIAELIAQTQGVDMNTAKGIIAKSLKAECANMDEVADKLNILSRNLYTLDVENCKAQGIDESVARDRLKKNRDAIRKYFDAYGRYNQVIGAIAEQYNGLSDIQKQEIDNIVDEYRRTHENSIVTEAQDKASGSVNETNGRVQEVRLFGSEDEEPAKVLRGNVATTTNEQGQTIIDRTASDPIITIEDSKGARQISPSEIMEVTGDASQEEVDAVTRSAEFLEEKNKLDYPVGSLITTPGADRYSVVVRSDASGVYIATMDENTGEVVPVNISDGNGNISDAYIAVRPEDETPIGKLGGEILTYVGRDEAGNALIRHQDGREESVDANTLASYMENLEPLTTEDLNAVKGSEGAEQAQAQPQPEETGQSKEQTEEERQAAQLESDVAAYDTFASQGDTEYISQNLKEARTALKKAEKDHPTATNMEKRLAQLAEIQKAREDARREVERWERAQAFIDSRDGVKPSPESVETQEKAPQQPKENPTKDSTPLPDAMADSLIQSEGIGNAKRAVTVTKTDIKKKIEAERKKLEKIPLTEMSKRTKTKEKIESLNSQLQYWSDVETSLIEKEEAANPSTKAVDLKRLNEEKRSQREKALQDQGFYKPGKIVGEKWDAAPKKEGNTMVKTLADGTTVKGRFILAPAEALTPSHDGLNDYEIMEGAPVREDGTTVNSRDYKNSKDNQALTNNMAVDYDGQAVNDTPVTYRGNVYSGNGRTIAGQIAAAKGTDTKYTKALKANARMYGFSAEDVDAIPHARLVFELDEEMPYTPEVYAKFNQETMKKESSTEQAVASSKTLSEITAIKIADIIDGYANTDSYFASADAATSTLNMLVEEGVIGANEMPELRDRNGKLTDTGRERITNILLGAMLEEDTIRAISEMPSLKQLAIRLAKQLLANRKYKSGSLLPEVNAALRLVASSRKQGYSVQENLKQADLFGQGAADTHSVIEKCLAVSFEEGVDISKDLLNFINQKSADCLGISDIFTGKIYDKQSVADSAVEYYNNVILNKDYGKGRQQRDIPNSGRETADRGAGEREHLRSGPGGNDGETSEGQEAKSRQRAVEAAVKFASELGVKPVIVRKGEEEKLTRQAQQVLAAGERFTAYYDKARNEVVIYEPYFHTDASKAVGAMAHEIVAHKGLREMLGEERFNALLDNVWDAMSDAAKDYYASYIYSGASDSTLKKLGLDRGLDTGNPLIARQIRSKLSKDKELTRQAADECIAGYAETQRFDGVVQAIRNFLNKILSAITGEKIELTAQNVERLLQASAQRLRDNAKEQEKREKKEENATTDNNVEEVRPNKPAPRKIEDFGEKIGGARKDIASEIADKINPHGNTFSKVFPKFDMHKLLEKGLDPKMAASLKFCISIAKKNYKQNKKRYGEEKALSAAAFYAAYAKRMLEGETTPAGFTSNGWVFTETGIKLIEANIELYKRLEDIYGEGMHDIDFSDYEISYTIPKPGASLTYSYKDKDGKWQTETIDTPFYTYMSRSNIYKPEKLEDLYKDALEHIQRSVSYDATHKYNIRLYVMRSSGKHRLGVKVGSEIVFLTEEGDYDYGYINEHNAELQALAERKIAEMKAGRKAEGKKAEIDIVSEYVDGARKYTIAVKLDKQWKSISHYVGSRDYKSLLDYKKEHSDELQEKAQQILDEYEAGKKFKPELNLTQERRRIGDDHRQGHDVSPERFSEVFGFRGVEFGNYVTAKERQQSLNDAFDALLDMADVIGVSPKALSLNGQLSLAFGARGKSSAKAHYEPNKNVINITKKHGAGSLAHEYFHALDYYFGQREKGRTATESKFVDDVRPEVAEAFNSLMETIKKSDYFKRSKALEDLIHPNVVLINGIDPRYYVQPTELGARAFGDYIIRKLSDKGHVNDYLSSFTTVDEWNGNPNVYPFPIDSDAEVINKAFDKLFDIIQEKEVEDRRVLFQLDSSADEIEAIRQKAVADGTFMKAPNGKPTKLSERQWLQVRTRAFKEWFGDWETDQQGSSKIVDENGEPMVMYHGDKAKNRYSFLSDTFFTGDADYAKRYTQGTGEIGSYFLDIKKPFDIRNKEAYDILASYRGGNLPTKTDSGAMDWVDYDYEDLREYLNEKHPDKYDGFVIDEGADGGYGEEVKSRGLSYVPYSASQIKSATINNGDFSRENDDIRFQLIGETGAKSLDKAEEASYRMDGLKVARDMEKEGYNAKEVRMATGWERGADNLWRYEVSDISEEDLKNAITKANNEFKRRRFEEDVKEDNLHNAAWRIYDRLPRRLDSRYSDEEKVKFKELRKRADQLFKEAREARERRLELENNYERNGIQITLGDVLSKDSELMRAYPELADTKVLFPYLGDIKNGSYNPKTKEIKLNRSLNIKNLYSTLNHEVQHAIQDMEGFASGGSATDVLTSNIKEVLKSDLKKKLELKQQKLTAVESIMKSSGSELKDYAELEGKSVEDAMKSWSEEKKRLQEDKEEIEYMLDGIDKGYLRSDKAHEYYRRIAGEVEARNVQRRLNMSKEERRSTLLKDTEDVAREDQLFIVDNLSDSKSDKDNTLFQMKKAPSKYTARDGRTVEFRQLSLFDNSGEPSEQLKEENEDVFRRGYYNLKPGEFSDVERVFTERGYFEFTAKNKIKSPEDVAYIFKQLETEGVENSFGVLIDKNGKPYIIHLGIGSSSQTLVDAHALIAAADRIKPQKVYFIHNHPSGSLKASKPDVQTHQAIKQALGDVLQDGIIIDTVSGKFATFNSTSTEKHNMPENQEGAVPVEVHSFSKRVFGKDYDYSGKMVNNIYDVSSFLSSMRFGQRSKVGMLALTNANQITANIFIPEKLEKVDPVEIIGKIATFGGTGYILYSNEYSLDRRELGRIVRKIRDAAKPANIREVDVMLINPSSDGNVYIGASQAAGDVAFQLSTSRSRGETLQDLFESSMIENASRIDARGVNGRKYVSNKLGTISKAFTAGRILAIDAANSIISFAKAVLRTGEIDSVTGTMFSRILGKVEKAVSKTDQRKELEQIFDLLTGQAIATSEKALSQLLKYKVADVNQSGVSIAKNVDSATRVFVERMRDNMKEERATIEARLRELEDKLSAMGESEDKSETEAAIHGLEFALRYKDSVKASHDDIADMTVLLRQETKKLVGMRGEQRKRQQEVIASIDANIRETKLQLLKEVDTLCAELTDILNKGMEGRAKWLADTEDHKNAILHYAFSDLQGVKPERNAKRKSGNWLKEFFTAPIYNLDTMLRSFASKAVEGKGYLYNHFIPACIKASQKEFEGFRLAVKELDAKCAEIWGEGMTYDKVMKKVAREPRDVELEWLKENGETEKQTLTVGQIMYIYMVNKMTDGAMKLRTMEIMEDDVDTLKTLLPKEVVRLADWLQDEFLPSRKAEYNKTHRELFGRPMDEVKNYVPLAIASEAIDRKVDVNDSEEQSPMSSTVTGSIIKRRRNKKAIDIANTDAMALILRHLRDMEHWAAFSPVSRDFNTLLSSRLFRNKINAINPDNFRLFKSVAQIATGNYKPKSSRTGMLATKLVKLIGGSKIAFRLNTALKQFLSYPAYWAEVGSTPGFFASLAESTANPYGSVKWCYENLPLFRKRWDSKAAGQEYYNLSDVNWETMFGKAFEKIAKVGMIPNAVVDLIVCSYGAKAMYEAKYKFYIGRGYSEENAKSRAMTDAELVYNLSQQSTEGFAMSALQMDNGIFSRMVSLFNNSSFSYARQFVQGCRGLRAYIQHKDEMIEFRAKQLERDGMSEEEAKKQATVDVERDRTRSVAKVAIYGFLIQAVWNMGGAAWYLLDCAFSDDDDDKQAAVDEIIKNTGLAVVQPVRGLVGGATLESALQAAANSREFDAGSGVHPVVSDASRAAKAVHRIVTSQSSNTSDMLEMMNAVLNSGVSFVGLQPQTFVNAFDGVSDLVTTNKDLTWLDVRQDLALILNAPPSQINRMALRPRKGETFEEFMDRYTDYKKVQKEGLFSIFDTDYTLSKQKRSELRKQYYTKHKK